jgi:hypothetical protein
MDRFSRAQFLRAAVGLTSAAVGVGLLQPGQAQAAPAALEPTRSYAAGNFSLLLDGARQGNVQGFGGGSAYADVLAQPAGASYYRRKSLGPLKYEAIDLQVGLGLEPAVYGLISETWTGGHRSVDGAVQGFDVNGVAISERQFFNALLVETTVPTLDAGSKEAGYLNLTLAPEFTRDVVPSGKSPMAARLQKPWQLSNFRLAIDGLDATKVSRIESFSVGQNVVSDALGAQREYQHEPTSMEIPNLVVTFSQASAPSWQAWFNDFVIGGHSQQDKARSGTLALLGSDLKELVRIKLFGVGICKLGPARLTANSAQIARMTAELYCERMEFELVK